jgi:hypothetical protein
MHARIHTYAYTHSLTKKQFGAPKILVSAVASLEHPPELPASIYKEIVTEREVVRLKLNISTINLFSQTQTKECLCFGVMKLYTLYYQSFFFCGVYFSQLQHFLFELKWQMKSH